MLVWNSELFHKDLAKAKAQLPRNTQRALENTARYAAFMARLSRRFKNREGELRGSIHSKLVDPTHAKAEATAKHAHWVENGNAPPGGGNIYPKRAKLLVFTINGVEFKRRFVRPAAPRPFMKDARAKAEPIFERLVKEAADSTFA